MPTLTGSETACAWWYTIHLACVASSESVSYSLLYLIMMVS